MTPRAMTLFPRPVSSAIKNRPLERWCPIETVDDVLYGVALETLEPSEYPFDIGHVHRAAARDPVE